MTGIYKIESKIKPERIYIGSAVNIDKRWKEHKRDLRADRHHSPKLQRHYNKYDESDFIYTAILTCKKEDLISREQELIDCYKPYFNSCKIANSRLGLKKTQEAKDKISRANKGKFGNRTGVKLSKKTLIKAKVTRIINSVNKCIDNGTMYHSQRELKVMRIKKRLEKKALKEYLKKNKVKVCISDVRRRRKTWPHSSIYRGVCVFIRNGKKRVTSSLAQNGKNIHIGYFKTEKEAALAYNKKAFELFGEKANLNSL